jgi:hypothetical protein
MVQGQESQSAKIKRLEREVRVWREREQDFEERYQGPADVEGIGGRPAVIILRDKNMGEVKRIIDDLPNIPGLRPEGNPNGPPLGFRRAKAYVQGEVAKMILSLVTVGPYNTGRVRDFQRLDMWVYNRAGMLIRPQDDVIGQVQRDALYGLVVRLVFAPSAWHLSGTSQETEVQPVEAERKGFG